MCILYTVLSDLYRTLVGLLQVKSASLASPSTPYLFSVTALSYCPPLQSSQGDEGSEESSGEEDEEEGGAHEDGRQEAVEEPGEMVFPSSDVPVLPVADVIARARFNELFQSVSVAGLTEDIEGLAHLGEEEELKEGGGGATEVATEDSELDLEGIDDEEIDKVCSYLQGIDI